MKCPACELPLASGPDPSCSSATVHLAAAIELGRYALLVATVEGELQAARMAARRLPVLVSCADCAAHGASPDAECLIAMRVLPDEDVIPEWCPMRGQT